MKKGQKQYQNQPTAEGTWTPQRHPPNHPDAGKMIPESDAHWAARVAHMQRNTRVDKEKGYGFVEDPNCIEERSYEPKKYGFVEVDAWDDQGRPKKKKERREVKESVRVMRWFKYEIVPEKEGAFRDFKYVYGEEGRRPLACQVVGRRAWWRPHERDSQAAGPSGEKAPRLH
jgi:hypothetical protein